ncbi:MAG: heme-binding protein [bacterium]|nr:heme-binding protein [bacterium]
MGSPRTWKILRRAGTGLLIAPILFWLGISAGIKLTVAKDMPFDDLLVLVGQGLLQTISCPVFGCEAELLEGMESTIFDESLLLATPVALDIDERGRVLVAETGRQNKGVEDNREHDYWLLDDLASRTVDDRRAYYQKWLGVGRFDDPEHFSAESDRLVVLEDRDADGVADSRQVLAEWDEMATGLVAGVEAREGTIWVTSIPSVYRLEDLEGDGVAESVEALHTGFGVRTSLIGHDLHGLAWGPDGRLYFSMGDRGYNVTLADGRILEPTMDAGRGAVFRMKADGSEFEVFATGVRNPQELAFDDYGNLFTGDNNGDGGDSARIVYVVEGGETGWAMTLQSLAGDYIRGPWMAEGLWDLQHETQPAWVLPPVAHIANGPAGFVHYPGLGLPDRYRDHFFLCDYAYLNGRSGIWSFALEPRGAGFQMVDRHKFAWSVLATDFDFSWDGRMFATIFDQIGLTQKIVQWQLPDRRVDSRVEELERLARGRMKDLGVEELTRLLGFVDQRIRLRAQFELAKRREIEALEALVADTRAELIPRLHALWAQGQIGREGIRAIAPAGLDWAEAEPEEFRAQLAKVIGDAGADWLAKDLRRWLASQTPRVRFFAAQSLGRLGDEQSLPGLVEMLRGNADEDVFLRHAAVWALHRIGDVEAVWAFRGDRHRSVRLAVLLVLRQAGDSRIAHFLSDSDPLLVVEAARAIYDWPIDGAMPALAALASDLRPVAAEDTQTGQALHRRVIGANVRLRSEAGAAALAAYVRDESQLQSLREIALEALGTYSEPPPRDLTMGFFRPLPEADARLLGSVFQRQGRALIDSSLGGRAIEIASEIGALPLDNAELLELVRGSEDKRSERASALAALTARAEAGDRGSELRAAAQFALDSDTAALRNAGRDLLYALDPEAGLASLLAAVADASATSERQHAWTRLGVVDDARARIPILQALVDWESGALEDAVALEVMEAALAQGGELATRSRGILAPTGADSARLVDDRRWALGGGDAAAGRLIFQTVGDCQRCHGGGGGHGGGAGPDLAGVSRKGARYVLESVLIPSARITEGFGSVVVTRRSGSTLSGLLVGSSESEVVVDVGAAEPVVVARGEITSQSEPKTGMPPMGLALEPRALRDVVAYVMSLE